MQALEKDSAVGTEFLRRSCPTHGQRPKLEPVVASFVRTRLIDRQQQTFGNGVSLARRKKRWRFIKAFAARIQAPIDDVHSHPCICLSRLAAPACTIRRGVSFLSFEMRLPLAVLTIIVYVLGALTGGSLLALLRRSYERSEWSFLSRS
jgi:hypothetical protein